MNIKKQTLNIKLNMNPHSMHKHNAKLSVAGVQLSLNKYFNISKL